MNHYHHRRQLHRPVGKYKVSGAPPSSESTLLLPASYLLSSRSCRINQGFEFVSIQAIYNPPRHETYNGDSYKRECLLPPDVYLEPTNQP